MKWGRAWRAAKNDGARGERTDAGRALGVNYAESEPFAKQNLGSDSTTIASSGSSFWSVAPFWAWAAICAGRRQLRWDQLAVAALATGLAYGPRRARRVYRAVAPIAAVGLLYDAMRLVKDVGVRRDTVHLRDLRRWELALFGVGTGRKRITLHDWFQKRRVPALDLLCAIPYATFLYVVVAYDLYLMRRDPPAQKRFAWGFLLLNVAGYATYHLYPAAPPWYFHKYGNAVKLSVLPDAGPNLKRVDAMLGVDYFRSFYSRGSDVFGAMPSLHAAYPMLMILEGWPLHGGWGRSALVLFYTSMCFSAVYLDHHWVLDVVAGSVYAVGGAAVIRRLLPSEPSTANSDGDPLMESGSGKRLLGAAI
jgi:membrane-associated phospholipid phosphatase